MNWNDRFNLMKNEFRYEKKEWIVVSVLHFFIYSVILSLAIISFGMDDIFGEYLLPVSDGKYVFEVRGYEDDKASLERMGFTDIEFDKYHGDGSASIKTLDGIWIKKLIAVCEGKDIWNAEFDDYLGVMLFCQMSLIVLCFVLFIFANNIFINSIIFKLMRRKNYINMLSFLGCSKNVQQSIFFMFFKIRNTVAYTLAVTVAYISVKFINRYIHKSMKVNVSFNSLHVTHVVAFFIFISAVEMIVFKKHWRQTNEE